MEIGYRFRKYYRTNTSINWKKNHFHFAMAGFSAPMGYPIGMGLNNGLLNFDKEPVSFAPYSEMAISTNGQISQIQITRDYNFHQKCFKFCKRLIHEYYVAHNKTFDYEVFYDFIKVEIRQWKNVTRRFAKTL